MQTRNRIVLYFVRIVQDLYIGLMLPLRKIPMVDRPFSRSLDVEGDSSMIWIRPWSVSSLPEALITYLPVPRFPVTCCLFSSFFSLLSSFSILFKSRYPFTPILDHQAQIFLLVPPAQ